MIISKGKTRARGLRGQIMQVMEPFPSREEGWSFGKDTVLKFSRCGFNSWLCYKLFVCPWARHFGARFSKVHSLLADKLLKKI